MTWTNQWRVSPPAALSAGLPALLLLLEIQTPAAQAEIEIVTSPTDWDRKLPCVRLHSQVVEYCHICSMIVKHVQGHVSSMVQYVRACSVLSTFLDVFPFPMHFLKEPTDIGAI